MNCFTRNPGPSWDRVSCSHSCDCSAADVMSQHLNFDLWRAWGCLSTSTINSVGWKWFIYIIPLLVAALITPALALGAWLSAQGTCITQCQTSFYFIFFSTFFFFWLLGGLEQRGDVWPWCCPAAETKLPSSFRLSNASVERSRRSPVRGRAASRLPGVSLPINSLPWR